MKLAIIIPTLNEEKTIHNCLKYLENNEGLEVVVSDGGSTDSTLKIAEKFAQIVRSSPGRGTQMNAGAAASSCDILLFFHADTTLPEGWRDSIISVMSDKKVVGGAFSLEIETKKPSLKLVAATANLRTRITNIPYGDQGIFVRRSVFEEIGGFRDFPIMEDVDLMRRLKKVGGVVLLKDRVKTSDRRWRTEGVVYTTIRNWLLLILYYIGVSPHKIYRFYKTVR